MRTRIGLNAEVTPCRDLPCRSTGESLRQCVGPMREVLGTHGVDAQDTH